MKTSVSAWGLCWVHLLLTVFFSPMGVKAERHSSGNLLPMPQQIRYTKGYFQWGAMQCSSSFVYPHALEWIQREGGSLQKGASHTLVFHRTDSLLGVPLHPDEAYKLRITPRQISIEAVTETGFYRALQTLSQLKQDNRIPCCEVVDWPAFRVRGFMHDVGRSYISVDELKKQIERLAAYKINVFHWHLTENQAWRLESKRYPALTAARNMTRFPGRYYTQEEAKELVRFCKEHHVWLIPEIDMPGHSAAFVRAFQFDMQSEQGKQILKNLLDEVCEVFEVPYIHIGTDEVQFVDKEFVPEMVDYLRGKGKKVISWNPGWNYEPNEIDMLQMWSYRGKGKPGIPVIDSRFHYLNHFDVFADIVALYRSRIAGVTQGSPDVAGTIACVWNDRVLPTEEAIVSENNFYPSLLTLAERAWRGGGSEYFDKQGVNLPTDTLSEEWKAFADFERRMLWHKKHRLHDVPFPYVKQTHIRWCITDPFPNEGDLKRAFLPEQSLSSTYTYQGNTYQTRLAVGATVYLRHVWGKLLPAFYPDWKENHTAYAYTYVYSPRKQRVGALVEFQNYSRSESDLPPPSGKWDYKESQIWLNDVPIPPPVWSGTHTERDQEIPLGNENWVSRSPIPVVLNKGWNKVLVKLPVGKFQTPELRLVKWMFTCAFVSLDATDGIEDLVYSPTRSF